MTSRWTELDLHKYGEEQKALMGENPDLEPDKGPEANLQKKIKDYCEEHGYLCLNYWKSKKVWKLPGYIPGWPDQTIFTYKRVVLLELKAAKGVLRPKQKEIHQILRALGHEVHQVKSYKRFLEIMGEREKTL